MLADVTSKSGSISSVKMVETVKLEVEVPPDEFVDEMLSETGKETLDDLITDLLDASNHKYKQAMDREWETGVVEIPADLDSDIKSMANDDHGYESPTAMLISWTLKELYESRGHRV